MDPITLSMLLSAGSSLFGGLLNNQTNSANLRAQQNRQRQLDSYAQNFLGGPGQSENMLMKFLAGFGNGGSGLGGSGEEWNAGQDALMQMLRADPTDSSELFKSWEPLEQRTLDNSLSNFWGTTTGLGQRFGSAAAKETGKIRGQQAENNMSRRAETTVNLTEANKTRQLGAAQALQQAIAQMLGVQMGGYQSLIGAEQNRNQLGAGLLSGGAPQQQPNQLPGAFGDISQLLLLLPLLKQLQGGGTGTGINTNNLKQQQIANLIPTRVF